MPDKVLVPVPDTPESVTSSINEPVVTPEVPTIDGKTLVPVEQETQPIYVDELDPNKPMELDEPFDQSTQDKIATLEDSLLYRWNRHQALQPLPQDFDKLPETDLGPKPQTELDLSLDRVKPQERRPILPDGTTSQDIINQKEDLQTEKDDIYSEIQQWRRDNPKPSSRPGVLGFNASDLPEIPEQFKSRWDNVNKRMQAVEKKVFEGYFETGKEIREKSDEASLIDITRPESQRRMLAEGPKLEARIDQLEAELERLESQAPPPPKVAASYPGVRLVQHDQQKDLDIKRTKKKLDALKQQMLRMDLSREATEERGLWQPTNIGKLSGALNLFNSVPSGFFDGAQLQIPTEEIDNPYVKGFIENLNKDMKKTPEQKLDDLRANLVYEMVSDIDKLEKSSVELRDLANNYFFDPERIIGASRRAGMNGIMASWGEYLLYNIQRGSFNGNSLLGVGTYMKVVGDEKAAKHQKWAQPFMDAQPEFDYPQLFNKNWWIANTGHLTASILVFTSTSALLAIPGTQGAAALGLTGAARMLFTGLISGGLTAPALSAVYAADAYKESFDRYRSLGFSDETSFDKAVKVADKVFWQVAPATFMFNTLTMGLSFGSAALTARYGTMDLLRNIGGRLIAPLSSGFDNYHQEWAKQYYVGRGFGDNPYRIWDWRKTPEGGFAFTAGGVMSLPTVIGGAISSKFKTKFGDIYGRSPETQRFMRDYHAGRFSAAGLYGLQEAKFTSDHLVKTGQMTKKDQAAFLHNVSALMGKHRMVGEGATRYASLHKDITDINDALENTQDPAEIKDLEKRREQINRDMTELTALHRLNKGAIHVDRVDGKLVPFVEGAEVPVSQLTANQKKFYDKVNDLAKEVDLTTAPPPVYFIEQNNNVEVFENEAEFLGRVEQLSEGLESFTFQIDGEGTMAETEVTKILDRHYPVSKNNIQKDKDYQRAVDFAKEKHGDQKRKYTGEPYTTHTESVADKIIEVGGDKNMVIAALLHDVVEDTSTTMQEIEAAFGEDVANLVRDLTDTFTKEAFPEMNRAQRKAAEAERLSGISERAKVIKQADIANNLRDIMKEDPSFAKVFLREAAIRAENLVSKSPEMSRQLNEVIAIAEDVLSIPASERIVNRSGIEVTEDNMSSIAARATDKPEMVEAMRQMSASVKQIFPGARVFAHDNASLMNQHLQETVPGLEIDAEGSSQILLDPVTGNPVEVHISLDKGDVMDVYHEVAHPFVRKAFGTGVEALQKAVNTVRDLVGPKAAAKLDKFAKEYNGTEAQLDEFLTELGAMMTLDLAKFRDKTWVEKVKTFMNDIFREVFGTDLFSNMATADEVRSFFESLAGGLKTGNLAPIMSEALITKAREDLGINEKGLDADNAPLVGLIFTARDQIKSRRAQDLTGKAQNISNVLNNRLAEGDKFLTVEDGKAIVAEVMEWSTWYEGMYEYLNNVFGEFTEDITVLLSLASTNSGSAATVGLAINNADRIYRGEMPLGLAKGYILEMLEGKPLEGKDKLQEFIKAILGDKDAIPVDSHVWSIFKMTDKTTSPRGPKQYEAAKEFIRDVAKELSMDPRAVQAALWAANIYRNGNEPSSYTTQFEKHVNNKGLTEKIAGWREKGYTPVFEVYKSQAESIRQTREAVDGIIAKASRRVPEQKSYPMSLLTNKDMIDDAGMAKIFEDVIGNKRSVMVWVSDQSGMGEVRVGDRVFNIDAGISFPKRGSDIWATSVDDSTAGVAKMLESSDYVFIVSGHPIFSMLHNKQIAASGGAQLDLFIENNRGKEITFGKQSYIIPAGKSSIEVLRDVFNVMYPTTPAVESITVKQFETNSGIAQAKAVLNKFNSIEELFSSNFRKPVTKFLIENGLMKKNTDLKHFLTGAGFHPDLNSLRDGYLVAGDFGMGDIIGIAKSPKLDTSRSANHSTYDFPVTGEFLGVPGRVYSILDIMPHAMMDSMFFSKERKAEAGAEPINFKKDAFYYGSGARVMSRAIMSGYSGQRGANMYPGQSLTWSPMFSEAAAWKAVEDIRMADPAGGDTGVTFNLNGTTYTANEGLVIGMVSKNMKGRLLSSRDIRMFVQDNMAKISNTSLMNRRYSDADTQIVKVGLYKFPGKDLISIDLNMVIPEISQDLAVEFGRRIGQAKIFNLRNSEYIETGADGMNPMVLTDAQFAEATEALSRGEMPKFLEAKASRAGARASDAVKKAEAAMKVGQFRSSLVDSVKDIKKDRLDYIKNFVKNNRKDLEKIDPRKIPPILNRIVESTKSDPRMARDIVYLEHLMAQAENKSILDQAVGVMKDIQRLAAPMEKKDQAGKRVGKRTSNEVDVKGEVSRVLNLSEAEFAKEYDQYQQNLDNEVEFDKAELLSRAAMEYALELRHAERMFGEVNKPLISSMPKVEVAKIYKVQIAELLNKGKSQEAEQLMEEMRQVMEAMDTMTEVGATTISKQMALSELQGSLDTIATWDEAFLTERVREDERRSQKRAEGKTAAMEGSSRNFKAQVETAVAEAVAGLDKKTMDPADAYEAIVVKLALQGLDRQAAMAEKKLRPKDGETVEQYRTRIIDYVGGKLLADSVKHAETGAQEGRYSPLTKLENWKGLIHLVFGRNPKVFEKVYDAWVRIVDDSRTRWEDMRWEGEQLKLRAIRMFDGKKGGIDKYQVNERTKDLGVRMTLKEKTGKASSSQTVAKDRSGNLKFVSQGARAIATYDKMSYMDLAYLATAMKDPYFMQQMQDKFTAESIQRLYDRVNEVIYGEEKSDLVTERGREQLQEFVRFQEEEFYPKIYEMVNPIYRSMYHTNLPKVSGSYVPIYVANVMTNMVEMTPEGSGANVTSSFSQAPHLKQRTSSGGNIDALQNALYVMHRYADTMIDFAAFAEAKRDLTLMFRDSEVQRHIARIRGGKKYYIDVMKAFLEDIPNPRVDKEGRASGWMIQAYHNSVVAMLRLNLGTGIKQLGSMSNFVEAYEFETGVLNWVPGLQTVRWLTEMMNPIGWDSYVSDFFGGSFAKLRLKRGFDSTLVANSRSFIADGIMTILLANKESSNAQKFRAVEEFVMNTVGMGHIKIGDIGAFMGGKPIYTRNKAAYIAEGMSKAEAGKRAAQDVARIGSLSQQSTYAENRSHFQRRGTSVIFPYMTTKIQYQQKINYAFRNIVRDIRDGRMPNPRDIDNLFRYAIIQPAIYSTMSTLLLQLRGRWRDDDKEKEFDNLDRIGQLLEIGSYFTQGIPVLSDVLVYGGRSMQDKPTYKLGIGGISRLLEIVPGAVQTAIKLHDKGWDRLSPSERRKAERMFNDLGTFTGINYWMVKEWFMIPWTMLKPEDLPEIQKRVKGFAPPKTTQESQKKGFGPKKESGFSPAKK